MLQISWPNRITLARIVMIIPFVSALLNIQDPYWGQTARWTAVAVFFLMAISDGLDGYLARRLRAESLAGRFLDPMADKVLILCSVVLLADDETGVPGFLLPNIVAVIAVSKDLIVVLGFCIIYFSTSSIFIQPGRWGKWCTTLQLAAVVGILLAPSMPQGWIWFLRVLWWTATGLAVVTVISYFRLSIRYLARHDPTVKPL